MKPSEALKLHRDAIRRIVENNHAANPRVFGSVIHGNDTEGSDLDILVDEIDGRTTLVSLARIQAGIQALTGINADVLTPLDLHERFRSQVMREAQPV
ncbi:MAG TPA: nucleotidyltransferase family protein [Burkholderiaceae bacterium]|nr:nucleotidyltransferase family protein [Burkholderiaceae bacterium]